MLTVSFRDPRAGPTPWHLLLLEVDMLVLDVLTTAILEHIRVALFDDAILFPVLLKPAGRAVKIPTSVHGLRLLSTRQESK